MIKVNPNIYATKIRSINKQTNEPINEWINELLYKLMNKAMNQWTVSKINLGHINSHTNTHSHTLSVGVRLSNWFIKKQ